MFLSNSISQPTSGSRARLFPKWPMTKERQGEVQMCLHKNENEIVDDHRKRNGFENAGDGKFESSFCCV